jgi:mannosyl-3-phosphoglycerate phosphatase
MLASSLVVFSEPLSIFPLESRSVGPATSNALHALERRGIPLVFASRGTRAEVEFARRRLANTHPFITENGAGLYLPEGYFRQRPADAVTMRHYHCISLARPYAEACAALEEAAAEAGAEVAGFHQMSAREIAENSGLPLRFAELARQREYDEPFFFAGEEAGANRRLAEAAAQHGWQVRRGERFWHISSGADVGRAVRRLLELYRTARHARVRSVAIGSTLADLPLLKAAGRALVLRREGGAHCEELVERLPSARRVEAGGAEGWAAAVMRAVEEES